MDPRPIERRGLPNPWRNERLLESERKHFNMLVCRLFRDGASGYSGQLVSVPRTRRRGFRVSASGIHNGRSYKLVA
jgi:hypothetical protein